MRWNTISILVWIFQDEYVLVDAKAREIFEVGAKRSIIKCMIGFSYLSTRYMKVKCTITTSTWLQCDISTDKMYIITCETS